ncbi:Putative odorant-binding protein [Gryllus bimaculatus]|nr:Putative odorant-binding protein [Gryllus bimaculatus]
MLSASGQRWTLGLVPLASAFYTQCLGEADKFPRCKQEDPNINECIKKATNAVIPQLKDGIPSLGVLSLDPLKASSLDIDQGQGPIALKIKFTNVSVGGLSECKVSSSEIDLKKYTMRFRGEMEKVTFDADYEMNGRVLLLPVTGKGRCRLNVSHLKGLLDLKGKGLMKKNKNHFDITDLTLDLYSTEKLESHFDNLFNGDKSLGESMNTLLNENWKELWDFLKPAFDEAFGAIIHQYSRGIFNKVPFNDIFLE